MLRTFCDRCSTEIDPGTGGTLRTTPDRLRAMLSIATDRPREALDLCQECASAFRRWLESFEPARAPEPEPPAEDETAGDGDDSTTTPSPRRRPARQEMLT